jgi:hypothetical protein
MTMNQYRKSNFADLEAARQTSIRRQNLPPEEQIKEKLADRPTVHREVELLRPIT